MAKNLGPFLDVRIEDFMTRDPRWVEPDAPLSDAARTMVQGGFRHLPVLDEERRLVGMLSERDLRGKLGADPEGFPSATLEALSQSVASAMTPDPLSIGPETRLSEALELFAQERVGALPVVDEGDRLVGILSYVDVLVLLNRWLAEKGGAGERSVRRATVARARGRGKLRSGKAERRRDSRHRG